MTSIEPLTRKPASEEDTHHEPSVLHHNKQFMTTGKPAYGFTTGLPSGLHAH